MNYLLEPDPVEAAAAAKPALLMDPWVVIGTPACPWHCNHVM